MEILTVLLIVVTAVLYGQLNALKQRVDVAEQSRKTSEAAIQRELRALRLQLTGSTEQPDLTEQRPATPNLTLPVTTAQGFPPAALPDGPPPVPVVPREPVDVQRWLTRAGIFGTLIGLAFLLSALETRHIIGPAWRVLAGLALGGWLTWKAKQAATPKANARRAPRWEAETLGTLGVAVILLVLTFAARSSGTGAFWTVLMTVLTVAGVLLARGWGGTVTPVTSLAALAVALPFAHEFPGGHLYGLDLPGLLCIGWTLAALALLPLLPSKDTTGTPSLVPAGGVALAVLFGLNTTLSSTMLNDHQTEREVLTLLISALTLTGVLLRQSRERGLHTFVASAALATAAGTLAAIPNLHPTWAPAIATLIATFLLVAANRAPRRVDMDTLAHVTFMSAVIAALTATGIGILLHMDLTKPPELLPMVSALFTVFIASLALNETPGLRMPVQSVHPSRLLHGLLLSAPLALTFGISGAVLPGIFWLARKNSPSELKLNAVRSWHTWPLLAWAALALPVLAGVAYTESNRLASVEETILLFLGATALSVFAVLKLLSPSKEGPVQASLLLAWAGAWFLATLLAHGQPPAGSAFALTTPWLALLGGWLLLRAQPSAPGLPVWKWTAWKSGALLMAFALVRVLLLDLNGQSAVIHATGLLGAGLITVLAGVRLPPPPRMNHVTPTPLP